MVNPRFLHFARRFLLLTRMLLRATSLPLLANTVLQLVESFSIVNKEKWAFFNFVELNREQLDFKALFEKSGLTKAQVARLLHIDRSLPGKYLSGTATPSELRMREFARLVGSYPPLAQRSMILKDEEPSPGRIIPVMRGRMVPVISWARAGAALATDCEDLEGFIDEQMETDCSDLNAFALIIEGDSMEPKFFAGDRLVFSPNSEPRNGDAVVARLEEDGHVLLKQFKRTGTEGKIIQLHSFNPLYAMIEYPREKFRFIYPAVDMRRKLR